MTTERYAWVGRRPCGCIQVITADSAENANFVQGDLQEMHGAGLRVERVKIPLKEPHFCATCTSISVDVRDPKPNTDAAAHRRYDVCEEFDLNVMETCAVVRILNKNDKMGKPERIHHLERAVFYLERQLKKMRAKP